MLKNEKVKEIMEKLKTAKIVDVTTSGEAVAPISYEQKVAREIRKKYSADEELALINNYNAYLADNSLVEYKTEYEIYQAFREQCKQNAKEIE